MTSNLKKKRFGLKCLFIDLENKAPPYGTNRSRGRILTNSTRYTAFVLYFMWHGLQACFKSEVTHLHTYPDCPRNSKSMMQKLFFISDRIIYGGCPLPTVNNVKRGEWGSPHLMYQAAFCTSMIMPKPSRSSRSCKQSRTN